MNKAKYVFLLIIFVLWGMGLQAAPPGSSEEKANAAFQQGHYQASATHYQRLLAQNPGRLDYKLKVAESYLFSNQTALAEQHLKEIFKVDPTYVDALIQYGLLSAQQQKWEQARDLYGRAVREDEANAAAYLGLGNALMQLGDTESADAAFAQYQELTKNQ
jgi:Flp pilus assembly protein TadD